MDKIIRRKVINFYFIYCGFLILLLILFVIYRITFYLFFGQPLEFGNVPKEAPYIFEATKSFLNTQILLSIFLYLPVYLIWTIVKLIKKKFKISVIFFSLTTIIVVGYLILWLCVCGATWFLW
jgi:hypothetical protein